MRFVIAFFVGLAAFVGVFLAWPDYRYSSDCDADPDNLRGCTGKLVTDESTYLFGGGLRWVQNDESTTEATATDKDYAFQWADALAASAFAGFIVGGITGMIGGYIASKRKRPAQPYVVK